MVAGVLLLLLSLLWPPLLLLLLLLFSVLVGDASEESFTGGEVDEDASAGFSFLFSSADTASFRVEEAAASACVVEVFSFLLLLLTPSVFEGSLVPTLLDVKRALHRPRKSMGALVVATPLARRVRRRHAAATRRGKACIAETLLKIIIIIIIIILFEL